MALAMTFITVLAVVTDAGFTTWLIQLPKVSREATSTAFWISLTLGVLLAALLTALSVPIASALDSDELRILLPVLSVSLVVAGLSSVPAALLQREMRFRELAIRQVTATWLSLVVAIALALAGAGVWALVAQTLVRVVVAAVVLWWVTGFRPGLSLSAADARSMTAYGSKSLGVQMSTAFREQGEAFLVGAFVGTVALGFWSVAVRLVSVVMDLSSSAVGVVAFPVFAQLQEDRERLTRAFGRTLAIGAFVLAPLMVAMSLVSRDLVPLVFGDRWELSASVAAVLAISMLFIGLSNFHRAVLLATDRAGTELALTMVALAGQVAVVVALAGQGLQTVAAGLSAWAAVQFLTRALVARRALGIGAGAYGQTLAVLLASGVAAAAVLGADALLAPDGVLRIALVGLVGGVVYAGAVAVLARPTASDLVGSVTAALRRRRQARTT